MFIYIFVSVLMTMLMWILMYLDGKLFDHRKSKWTYIKNTLVTVLLSCGSLYLGQLIGTNPFRNTGMFSSGTTYLSDVGQDILSGPPAF